MKKRKRIEDEFSRQTKDELKEKIGNLIIDFSSSWSFLFLNVIFFTVWLSGGFDYNTLTLIVSLEAIILSVLLLIGGGIKEKSDRERAIKDYKMNYSMAKKIKNIEMEVRKIKNILNKK
jgi:uncharacterized membrane protein